MPANYDKFFKPNELLFSAIYDSENNRTLVFIDSIIHFSENNCLYDGGTNIDCPEFNKNFSECSEGKYETKLSEKEAKEELIKLGFTSSFEFDNFIR